MTTRHLPLVLLALLLVAAAAKDPAVEYNAGVDALSEGDLDDAIRAFESASVAGKGDVRSSALLNLAICRARQGDGIREEEPEKEEREAKMNRLAKAASAYRTALALFRRVPPPSPDADQGARAAKVRLLATMDELARLAEAERQEEEKKALSNPPRLLLAMLGRERDRRRGTAALAAVGRRHRRLPALRLRKAEYADRELLGKLAGRLEKKPPAPVVKRAAEAMAGAESRLDAVDLEAAREAQTKAIAALTEAALALPAPAAELTAKLRGDQESLLARTKAGDVALAPVEEDEIVPFLDGLPRLPDLPEAAKVKIGDLAGEAETAAKRAAAALRSSSPSDSEPDQQTVIEKLEAIADLLPKPPESPAEKLRKLLATQVAAREEAGDLSGMNDEARTASEGTLAEGQTARGREAGEIAKELEGSRGEREGRAAPKVREAEREIHASSEALRRDRVDAATGAIDRDIDAIREALGILSGGKQDQKDGNGQTKPRPKPDQKEQQKKKGEEPGRLTPEAARRLMREMDRERREEEKKLFPGGGGARVDKDW